MKEKIEKLIIDYVEKYPELKGKKTTWKIPLVKFADSNDKMFNNLKTIVSPSHSLPEDFLKDANTVIAYFLPFDEKIANSNYDGKYASKSWANAYIETNGLISDLNEYIKIQLKALGYKSASVPATHNFDESKLISDWSHRHVANIAGLGTFGINNMLITEKGCCGRVGSIVTNLKIKPSKKIKYEYCLYKDKNICNKCVERCSKGALSISEFNRFKCYDLLLENDEVHSDLGLTDACGKCCVKLPCSFTNPNNI